MNRNHYEFNIICKYVHYNFYILKAIHIRYVSYVFQEPGQKLSFELKIILTLTVKHVSFRIMVIDNNVKD